MRASSLITALLILTAVQFASVVARADNYLNGMGDTTGVSSGGVNGGSSKAEELEYMDPFGDEPRFPRWIFHAFGINYLKLDGVSTQLDSIARGKRDGLGIAYNYSEKFDRHYSLDGYVSVAQLGDLILANVLVGVKYDLSPFPKTALTPWGGLYLSLNYLDDRSDLEPGQEQGEDWDGYGLGVAAAVGLSMRLGGDFILQASARRNSIGAVGLLEDFTGFADRFTAIEYSIMIVLIADLEEDEEIWSE